MPIRVHLPNGGVANFPDGTPETDIAAAIQRVQGPAKTGDTYTGPDTFMGGALESLKTTAVNTARGIGRGLLDTIDPRQVLSVARSLQGPAGMIPELMQKGPSQMVADARQQASALRDLAPSADAKPGSISNPETGGRLVGNLGGALLTSRLAPAAARKVGPLAEETATSWYERMLKPNRSTIDSMSKFGRTTAEKSRNISRELLQHGATIDKSGADAFDAGTVARQGQVDALVAANPEARGSTQLLRDALARGRQNSSNQWAASGDTGAYDKVAADALRNPKISKTQRVAVDTSLEQSMGLAPNASETKIAGTTTIPRVTAKTARKLTQGTYRNMSDKAYGELQGPQVEAHKAAASGGRAILNEAIPQIEPINNDIAKRIDLGQVLDEAAFRAGKNDPVSLGQTVAAAGQRPAMVGLSTLSRPGIGSRVARSMFRTGQGLTRGGDAMRAGTGFQPTNAQDLIRAALLTQLLQQTEQSRGNE